MERKKMPTPDAATTAATTEPREVAMRFIIKSEPTPDGAAPMLPKWNMSLGGVGFAIESYRTAQGADGDRREVPVRGNVQAITVGGAECTLDRVRKAVARKVVRWTHRPKLRGLVLSVRECSRVFDGDVPAEPERWVETRARNFKAQPGDVPMSECVSIELVIPGSDYGPVVSLKPGDPLPEVPSTK